MESRERTVVSSSNGRVVVLFGILVVLIGTIVESCVNRFTCGLGGDGNELRVRRVVGDAVESCGTIVAEEGDGLCSGLR